MADLPKIVITGATGFVARHVRRHLSGNGAVLLSISRRDFKSVPNEEKIVTDSYDPKILLSVMRGSDVLIHLIGIGRQSFKHDFDTVNSLLTGKMLDLCKSAGIKKIVYLSGLGVSPTNPLEYFLSKYRAEQQIVQSGLNYTIFRPSYIVGRDDLLTKHLKKQIKRGLIVIPGSGKFQIQPIHIQDVAKIISESITFGKFSNKIFDLVGPKSITYRYYIQQFLTNARARIKEIPLEVAYCDAINKPGKSDFGVDDLNLLVGNFNGNFEALQRASKVRIRPVTN